MTKGKQRQKVSGAVLVMVLVVMVVLIIMLMATLTIVTTAGQRIYTKYEENQAYYSARSALDIFTQSMLGDAEYLAYDDSGNIRTYSYTDSSGTVSSADMKQGLALQLELYKITSQGEKTKKVAQSIHAAMSDEDARKALEFAENLELDEVFASGTPENQNFSVSRETTGMSSSNDLPYITYQVTLPTLTDPKASGSQQSYYGEMVDTDGATGEQVATIKVEVLDRLYDTGGAYSGNEDDIRRQIINILESGDATQIAALKENIKNGNRAKDKITVKITSTVEYKGKKSTAVLICDTKERPTSNSSRALTTFGGSGSDNMTIIDGISIRESVQWSNDGYIYGNTYIEQNLTMNTGAIVVLTDNESFLVGNDLIVNNSNFKVIGNPTPASADSKPYVFIGGKYTTANMQPTTFQDVDIITHGVLITGNFFANTSGNVYCYGDFDISPISSTSTVDGDLYVEGSLISGTGNNKTLNINGDLYVKGRLDARALSNLNVTGNVYVQGDIYFNNGGNFAYDDGGDLTISGVGGDVYLNGSVYDDNGISFLLESASPTDKFPVIWTGGVIPSMDFPEMDEVSNPVSGKASLEAKLPDGLTANGVKKNVPTHNINFNQYYAVDADGDFVDEYGAKLNFTAAPYPSPAPVPAEQYAEETGFTPADLGITEELPNNASIDTATTGDASYIIRSGRNYGTVRVGGGGTVEFVLQNTASNQYQFKIDVLDNDTTVKIFGADNRTGVDYQLFNCTVLNPEVKAAYNGGAAVNVGSKEGCNIKVPKIHYYFSKDVEVKFYNGGFYTGYFYAPNAVFSSNASGKNMNLNYNGTNIGSKSITIIGSLLANEIDFPNNNGVAYINPSLEETDGYGEPHLNWTPYKYTRN